jgi:PAS domain S-box-containing protein
VSARAGGQLLAVNAAWSESTGYARDEALGRSSLELGLWVHGSERPAFVERVRRGEAVRQIATRHRRRNGEIVEVLLSGAPIEWDGVPAMLVIPYDVTALKRVEEEIRRLNASLEDKVRERTAEIESFSYTVSHDLRAPLRHLSGFAGLLRERPAVQSDPEAMKYAERLGASAKRLGHMVDSLLEYSRLGRNPLVPRDVDLAAEAQLIIGELGAQARERQVRWKIGPLPVVRGDSTLLRSVLQNLLDNALKYTRTRGEALVELGARAESAQWIVFVRDNGVGFDMRYAGKLFGVFQRLHGEREFEGTGIGLAHAARIVQRHGGRMWCEAAPEQGACFFFSLPR